MPTVWHKTQTKQRDFFKSQYKNSTLMKHVIYTRKQNLPLFGINLRCWGIKFCSTKPRTNVVFEKRTINSLRANFCRYMEVHSFWSVPKLPQLLKTRNSRKNCIETSNKNTIGILIPLPFFNVNHQESSGNPFSAKGQSLDGWHAFQKSF